MRADSQVHFFSYKEFYLIVQRELERERVFLPGWEDSSLAAVAYRSL